MPIYEFYCDRCRTIYQFFSRTVNTEKIPFCPNCKDIRLQRIASVFSTISGNQGDTETDDDMPPIDEARMERAMNMLANEVDKIDEDDPRQAAVFMRKLASEAGIQMGAKLEEALARMEQGEDPDKIEEEMGDMLDEDELFLFENQKRKTRLKSKIKRDDKLYDL